MKLFGLIKSQACSEIQLSIPPRTAKTSRRAPPSASSTGSIGNGAGTLINISEILALLRPAASEWNRLADKEIRFVGREEHTEQCIFTAGCQTRTGHSLEDLLETG